MLARGWEDGCDRLALVASALAVDSASWTTLTDDLDAAYRVALQAGVAAEPRCGGPSFQAWLCAAPRLVAYREPPGPQVHGLPGELNAPRGRAAPPALSYTLRGDAREILRAQPRRDAEALLARALAQGLNASAVELAATRRGEAPGLPDLERTVGQFGALRPCAAAAGESGQGPRIRLCLLPPAAATAERGFRLEEVAPPPVLGMAAEAFDLQAVAWDDGAVFRLHLTSRHAWPASFDASRVVELLQDQVAGLAACDPVPFRFPIPPEDLDELLD